MAAMTVPAVALAATACTGPDTETAPYVLPSTDGVFITSLLTVGDAGAADNGYEMVGIPDGLGVRLDEAGKLVVHMNHELRSTAGIPRLHGERGAFISRLEIDPNTNDVEVGSDLIKPGVLYYDYLTGAFDDTAPAAGTRADGKAFPAYTNAFNRFCSSTMTDPGQLFNARSGRGTLNQITFANEEAGDEGRVFGVLEDGTAKQLPRLGLFSWENTVAADNAGDSTLVMGNEDGAAGQLRAYIGRKIAAGNPFQRAGLANGRNHVVTLADADPATADVTDDIGFRAAYDKGQAVPFTLSDVEWNQSGLDQNIEARAEGLSLNRIEDGAFDPSKPNDYYFVTTEGGEGTGGGGGGGLWKLSYTDVDQPALGGTLTLLLDGSEGITLNKPDNLDIDAQGNMLIQEDPGADEALARIVAYRLADGATGEVAKFNADLFSAGGSSFLTNDEESSGVVDVSDLAGPGTWLFDAQVHTSAGLPAGFGEGTVEEYVERGQLLQLVISDWSKVYAPAQP